MDKLDGLLERRNAKAREMEELVDRAEEEDRDFTEEEQKKYDGLKADVAALDPRIARLQEQREIDRRAPSPGRDAGAALAVVGEDEQEGDVSAPRPFTNLAEQLFAIQRASTGGGVDPRLYEVAAAIGAGEAIDSDGGFLVQHDFAAEILRRMYQLGNIMSRVRRIPISPNANGLKIPAVNETSRATGSRWGGVQGYWVDGGTAPTGSKPKFRRIELELKKLACLGYATDELLSDSTAMSSIFTEAFAEELVFLAEDSVVNGTGAGQPLGILTSNAAVSVAKESGQAAATVVSANIFNMWSRMWSRSRANAVWYINQDIEPQLFQMNVAVGSGGSVVYLPANGMAGSPFSTLMGRPVIPIEYCATLGTVGDIIFADMSQYIVIEKGGVNQAQSIHVRFTTDETAFRATMRIDGQPAWNAALTPFKGSNTQSPFITLATRA